MNCIRQAHEQDISRIAEILIFTKRMNYRSIFHDDAVSFGKMQVLPLADSILKEEGSLQKYWVYDDGFVKGLIRLDGRRVTELYVDSFFEGQGIGSKLIEFAVQKKGASFLWVLEKNTRGIAFYKRHGFAITGERKLEEGTAEYIVKMVR